LPGDFTGEFGAFKAKFNAFDVGAVADLAKLVFACDTANVAVGAGAFLHFWAFFTCYSANTDSHFEHPQLSKDHSTLYL